MEVNDFIPECFIDTNLVETFLDTRGANHQKGCNVVGKVMKEKFADRFAVGIIDADKRLASYSKEFECIAENDSLRLLKHPSRHHYLILICPAMDKFILDCAAEAGLDVTRYGFSPNLPEFIEQTKNVASKNDYRFKCLFSEFQHHGEAKRLKDILQYLQQERYQADALQLKEFFIK